MKNKLDAKGKNERRYLVRALEEYDQFMKKGTVGKDKKEKPVDEFDAATHVRSKDIIEAWRKEQITTKTGYVCHGGRKRHFEDVDFVCSEDSDDCHSAVSSQSSTAGSFTSANKKRTKSNGKSSFPYASAPEVEDGGDKSDKSDQDEEKCEYEVDDE